MNSPSIALVWEYWRRSAASTLFAVAMGVAIPSMLYGVAGLDQLNEVALDRMSQWHSVFFALILPAIVHSAFVGAGEPQSKFTLPASSRFLVGTSLLFGSILVVLAYTTVVLAHRGLYGISWPLLKPASYLVVTFVWCHSQCWTLRPTSTVRKVLVWVLSLLVPTTAICYIAWKETAEFGLPWRQWYFGEPLILAVIGIAGVVYGLRVMREARLGEPRWSTALWCWFTEWFDRTSQASGNFAHTRVAESWLEWREKGRSLLVLTTVSAGMLAALLVSGFATPGQAADFVFGLSWMILLSSFLFGGYLGHCGKQFDVRPFKATRPLTDTELADGILLNVARTTGICWLVWLAGEGTTLFFTYDGSFQGLRFDFEQVAFGAPVLVLGAWTMPSLGAALFLNRRGVLIGIGVGMFCVPMWLNLMFLFTLHHEIAEACQLVVCWAVCLASLVGAIAIFGLAFARGLIGTGRCALAVVTAVLTMFFVHGLVRILSDTSPMQMAAEQPLLGLLWVCLGVAPALPLAATPLAMWSNRHR